MSAKRWLNGVGGSYFALQLAVVGAGRAPSWDEAIYLSQVSVGARALPFVASRARGITLLVLPVARSTSSVEVIRLLLMVASAVALVAVLRVWIPVIGGAAPLAAAGFGFSWLGLLYGSGVMPNLWTAMLGVAATGWVARSIGAEARRRDPWRAGVCVGLMALMRPPDALVLVGALGLCVALLRGPMRSILPSFAGVVAGTVPWIVEMSVRFGGPVAAVRRSLQLSHVAGAGLSDRLVQNLALTRGPTIGPVADPRIPSIGVLWWALLALIPIVAVISARRGKDPERGATLAAVGGFALAGEYLFVVAGLAPRFLLPAYGLLSVSAAVGAMGLRKRMRSKRVSAALVASACVLFVWHLGVARRVTSVVAAADERSRQVGVAIRDASGSAPCAVVSSGSFPQIGFASGCEARPLRESSAPTWIASASGRGEVGFLALRGPGAVLPPGLSGSLVPGPSGWMLYQIAGPD